MGCILAKLECCVVARCCHCIHLRLGCILIATFAIVVWIAVILYFLLDEGIGFFSMVNDNWLIRGYILAILGEAAVRIIISIVLIVGAAKKQVNLLTVFLATWFLLITLIVGDLVFAIVISQVDGATVVFSLVYAAGRFCFTVLALVIVNSYRVQLVEEMKRKPAIRNKSVELVL